MQNGLVIEHGVQVPFLIDPNTTAVDWLVKHLSAAGDGKKQAKIVTQQDPRLVNQIENAVRFGLTLIVSEVDGVLPLLYPLLRKDLFRQGPRQVVQIGEQAVDYNEQFRLFLVTRDSTPDIPATAASLIAEVNFTVTRSGLEGQLLGLTLHHERPELEKKKSALLAEEEQFKIQLADLEKSLLRELAASEGNILENKTLIESLNKVHTSMSQSKSPHCFPCIAIRRQRHRVFRSRLPSSAPRRSRPTWTVNATFIARSRTPALCSSSWWHNSTLSTTCTNSRYLPSCACSMSTWGPRLSPRMSRQLAATARPPSSAWPSWRRA